jgi:hypothetical protein
MVVWCAAEKREPVSRLDNGNPCSREIWIVDIGQAIDHLEPLTRDYGVVVVTIVLSFESFGAPLPGESLLIVASVLAGRGDVSFPWLLFFSWLGAVLGDNIGYLGRLLGRGVILRHGKKIGLDAELLKKIEDVFGFGLARRSRRDVLRSSWFSIGFVSSHCS